MRLQAEHLAMTGVVHISVQRENFAGKRLSPPYPIPLRGLAAVINAGQCVENRRRMPAVASE
jgi:hypothetical protein